MCIESIKITVQYIYRKIDINLLLLCYSTTFSVTQTSVTQISNLLTSFVTNCDCFIRVYSLVQNNNLDDCPIRLNHLWN